MEQTGDFSRRFTTVHVVPYTTEPSLTLVSLTVKIKSAALLALRLSRRHSVNQLYGITILQKLKHYLFLNGPSPADPLHHCVNLHGQIFFAIEFRRSILAITRNDKSSLFTQNAHTALVWETLVKVYNYCSLGFGNLAHTFSISNTIESNNDAVVIPAYVDSVV